MTSPLTSIPRNMPRLAAGMPADSTFLKDCVAGTSEEESAEIAPGRFVAIGETDPDNGVRLPDSVADVLKGVAVFGHSYSPVVQVGTTGFKPGITFDVARHGRWAVEAQDAMDPTSEVHIQMVAETDKPVGTIRPTGATGKTIDASGWATVVESGDETTDNSPVLEIDLTNVKLSVLAS